MYDVNAIKNWFSKGEVRIWFWTDLKSYLPIQFFKYFCIFQPCMSPTVFLIKMVIVLIFWYFGVLLTGQRLTGVLLFNIHEIGPLATSYIYMTVVFETCIVVHYHFRKFVRANVNWYLEEILFWKITFFDSCICETTHPGSAMKWKFLDFSCPNMYDFALKCSWLSCLWF